MELSFYHISHDYSYMYAYNEQTLSYYCTGDKFNDEYFQSVRQGYEFTFIDHIYEKNKKYLFVCLFMFIYKNIY